MKVAVIGEGVEGKSAQNYWQARGHEIEVRDQQQGPDYLKGLNQFDLIVRSPGVKPKDIFKANPNLDTAKITSVTNEFLAECPAKVIGVTGTKGKGTTASLIAAMLEAAGHKVWLGGNIGVPALDLLDQVQPEDWVVLELSSFQLMDARISPHVAVMLMMAEDHADWHSSMKEYLTAKQNIFRYQQPGDRAVFNACDIYSLQSGLQAPSDQVQYNCQDGAWVHQDEIKFQDQPICKIEIVSLPGRHNLDNICAAITAVWPLVEDPQPLTKALKAYQGLEHRLERVTEVAGVTYINDSYSASPGAALAAIRAFEQPMVLILGGFDRGLSYEAVAREIKQRNLRQVIVIGEISPKISKALDAVGYTDYILAPADMSEIVQAAAKAAQPGDVAVLSPGAPSFDMFKNFKERGEHFKAAVRDLEKTA